MLIIIGKKIFVTYVCLLIFLILSVKPVKPVIEGSDSPVMVDDSVNLTCSTSSISQMFTYKWSLNGNDLDTKESVIQFPYVSTPDFGSYVCMVTLDGVSSDNSDPFQLTGWYTFCLFYFSC